MDKWITPGIMEKVYSHEDEDPNSIKSKTESVTTSATLCSVQSSSIDEIKAKLDSYNGKFKDSQDVSDFVKLLLRYRTLTFRKNPVPSSLKQHVVCPDKASHIESPDNITATSLALGGRPDPADSSNQDITANTFDNISTRSRKRNRSPNVCRRRAGSSPSIMGRVSGQSSLDEELFVHNFRTLESLSQKRNPSGVSKKKGHVKKRKYKTTLPFVMDFLRRSQVKLPVEGISEELQLEEDWNAFQTKYVKDRIPSTAYTRSGIQTIYPKAHMLVDFEKFVAFTYYLGCGRAGACRIIPPADWSPQPGGYNKLFRHGLPDEKLENVNFKITDIYNRYPSHVSSKIVDVQYASRKNKMTIVEFYDYMHENNLLKANTSFDIFKMDLFDKIKNSSSKNSTPYGKDLHCSLFSPDVEVLNVNNLDSFLTRHGPFELTNPEDGKGLRSAYLYIGCKGSFFVPHVEDYFFFSLSYHHAGHSKFWRIVPPSSMYRMARCLKATCDKEIEGTGGCYLSPFHKSLEVEDSTLIENKIPFQWIEQVAGSFIMTYPKAYHSGFSVGMNIGESANFAFSKDWAKLALTFPVCQKCEDSPNCDLFNYAKEALSHEEFMAWEIGELELNGTMVGRYVDNCYNNKDVED